MPLTVIRDDITRVEADAIVNPANRKLEHGNGTSDAIFRAAGAEKLAKACAELGGCGAGRAVLTPGFGLKAKHIIHTVVAMYVDGQRGEEEILRSAYLSALIMAEENGCRSVAFPLLSSGNMGYPKDEAMKIALTTISEYLIGHEMLVYLVLYDRESFELSKRIFPEVCYHIDDEYVARKNEKYLSSSAVSTFDDKWSWQYESKEEAENPPDNEYWERVLAEKLSEPREDFQHMLLRLIAERGVKNYIAYGDAGVDKKEFSRVMNYEQKIDRKFVAKFIFYFQMGLREADAFMRKAGLAMSDADDFDIILRVMLEHRIYNVDEFQEVLAKRGIPLKLVFRKKKLYEDEVD